MLVDEQKGLMRDLLSSSTSMKTTYGSDFQQILDYYEQLALMMSSRFGAIFLVFGFLVVITLLQLAYYQETGSLTSRFGKKAPVLVYFRRRANYIFARSYAALHVIHRMLCRKLKFRGCKSKSVEKVIWFATVKSFRCGNFGNFPCQMVEMETGFSLTCVIDHRKTDNLTDSRDRCARRRQNGNEFCSNWINLWTELQRSIAAVRCGECPFYPLCVNLHFNRISEHFKV